MSRRILLAAAGGSVAIPCRDVDPPDLGDRLGQCRRLLHGPLGKINRPFRGCFADAVPDQLMEKTPVSTVHAVPRSAPDRRLTAA